MQKYWLLGDHVASVSLLQVLETIQTGWFTSGRDQRTGKLVQFIWWGPWSEWGWPSRSWSLSCFCWWSTAPSTLPSQPSVGQWITDGRKDNDDDGGDSSYDDDDNDAEIFNIHENCDDFSRFEWWWMVADFELWGHSILPLHQNKYRWQGEKGLAPCGDGQNSMLQIPSSQPLSVSEWLMPLSLPPMMAGPIRWWITPHWHWRGWEHLKHRSKSPRKRQFFDHVKIALNGYSYVITFHPLYSFNFALSSLGGVLDWHSFEACRLVSPSFDQSDGLIKDRSV